MGIKSDHTIMLSLLVVNVAVVNLEGSVTPGLSAGLGKNDCLASESIVRSPVPPEVVATPSM